MPETVDLNIIADRSVENLQRVERILEQQRRDNEYKPEQLSPQSTAYLNTIRNMSEAGMFNTSALTDLGLYSGSALSSTLQKFTDKRPSFTAYDIPISDAYEQLNSGEYVPRYENYIPNTNNEERLAQQQGTGEVWGRGLIRFGSQVLTSTVGNLASIPVGLSEWINTGNFEATYDNEFTRMLDDLDRKGQLNNNIYYSEEDKSRSVLGGTLTSRFWADKFLGGASFTVGMLLSEGAMAYLTGGGSLTTTAGRVGAKFASKLGVKEAGSLISKGMLKGNTTLAKTAANSLDNVGSKGFQQLSRNKLVGERIANTLNDARFLVTSTGYEAGMEARHFRKDAEEQFYDYHEQLGVTPTAQQTQEFRDNLDNNSNKVFGANLGLLGVSNTAMFGRMFGIGNPFKGLTQPINQALNSKIFGIATREVSPGVFEAVKRNTFQKILTPTWNGFIKPGFTEGVWEEGGQGIASNMMSEYMRSTYDPTVAKEVSGYTDAFYKSLSNQFGTKEGQEEVLIGSLIGVLFGGLGGSFTEGNRAYQAQTQIANLENQLSKAPQDIVNALYTQENFLSQVGNANRSVALDKSIEDANKSGEITDATLKSEALLISSLQAAHTVGKDGSFTEVLKGTIQGMDNTRLMEQYGLENIEQVEQFKSDKINTLTQISNQYSKNRKIAETYIGRGALPKDFRGKEQLLTDSLAFALTMSQSAERVSINALNTIKELFNSVGDTTSANTTDIVGMLSLSPQELSQEYNNTQVSIQQLNQNIRTATEALKQEQSQPLAERNVETSNKLEQELLDLTEQRALQTSVLNGVLETMQNNYYNKIGTIGTAPLTELTNLQTSLDQARKAVNALEAINPETYARLTTAFDALDKSNEYSQQFSDIYKGLLDPKFNTRIVKNIFGKQLANANTLNDLTRETLNKITLFGQEIQEISQPLSQEVYNEFEETGEIDNNNLNKLASKVVTGTLNPQETTLYEANKEVVDKIIQDNQITEVVEKLRNKETLTPEQETFYTDNKQAVQAILNDPLNSKGTSIVGTETPSLSEEIAEEVKANEASRNLMLSKENADINQINNQHNQFYKDKVKLGEITTEQALNELEKIGQQGSFEYQQLQEQNFTGQSVPKTISKEQLSDIVASLPLIKKYFIREVQDSQLEPLSQEDLNRQKELQEKQQKSRSLTKSEQIRFQELEEQNQATPLTEDELSEFETLLQKSKKGGLTNKELSDLEEIEQKLLEYNILQGTVYNGHSLLDLIKLYNQTLIEIENQEQNKTTFTESEYVQIAIDGEKTAEAREGLRNGSISQITEYVFAKFQDGGVYISHLKLSDILDKVLSLHPTAVIKINGDITQDFSKYNGKENIVAEVQLENNIVYSFNTNKRKGTIASSTIQLKSKNPSQDMEMLLGYKALSVPGQKGDYYIVYEQVENETTPVKSTFEIQNKSGLEYDSIEARKVKNGDTVELVYDSTDSYNTTLKPTERVAKANIYIVKNNKVVGRLKATQGVADNDQLHEIRKKVVAEKKANIKIQTVLAGLPIIQTNTDNTKKLTPVSKSDIVGQGYYLQGNPDKPIPQGVSTRYIESASSKTPTRRVPYVIVQDRISGQKIAFPVEISSQPNLNTIQQYNDILADTTLSSTEKALQLNDILIKNGIDLKVHSFNQDNVQDPTIVNDIKLVIEATPEPIDLDKFSSELYYDVSTVIDFNNNSFTPPKLILDFDSINTDNITDEIEISETETPVTNKKVSFTRLSETFSLNFESDIDKSLFIISNPKRASDYNSQMSYLRNELGLPDADIQELAQRIRTDVINITKKSNSTPNIPTLYQTTTSTPTEVNTTETIEVTEDIPQGTPVTFWFEKMRKNMNGVLYSNGTIKASGLTLDASSNNIRDLKPIESNIPRTLKNQANSEINNCKK